MDLCIDAPLHLVEGLTKQLPKTQEHYQFDQIMNIVCATSGADLVPQITISLFVAPNIFLKENKVWKLMVII